MAKRKKPTPRKKKKRSPVVQAKRRGRTRGEGKPRTREEIAAAKAAGVLPAAASPVNGQVPPPEHRFKPGESGNPAGRKTAGAYLAEWLNAMAEWTEEELRRVARDKTAPATKRGAAERMLLLMEHGDLADFSPVLTGDKTLEELRAAGINTEAVKKLTIKVRHVPGGDAGPDEIIERAIELHDRGGDAFDRVADRTEGRPTQTTRLESDGSFKSEPVVLMHTAPPEPDAAAKPAEEKAQ